MSTEESDEFRMALDAEMLGREAPTADFEFFMEARGYLSPLDEEMFWEWMDRLECKGEYVDQDRKLAIRLSHVPNQDHLWELIAFFYRYNIDLRQLACFETPENSGCGFRFNPAGCSDMKPAGIPI